MLLFRTNIPFAFEAEEIARRNSMSSSSTISFAVVMGFKGRRWWFCARMVGGYLGLHGRYEDKACAHCYKFTIIVSGDQFMAL